MVQFFHEGQVCTDISAVACTRMPGTSWFKLKDGNYLPTKCRLHYLLDRHIFGIIPTAMTSTKG